jgi:hypothetical protein
MVFDRFDSIDRYYYFNDSITFTEIDRLDRIDRLTFSIDRYLLALSIASVTLLDQR